LRKINPKKSFKIQITTALLLLLFISVPVSANADIIKFGKWVAVYEGGSQIHHWRCEFQWLTNTCNSGDIKAASPSTN
jgi:hypothetical protein